MATTAIADPSPPPAHRATGRSLGDRVRFVLRGIGQTLITAGLVVLLFVVYEVWITNLYAEREQSHVANAFSKHLVAGKDPILPLPGDKFAAIPLGTGIANLYIPRLGKDFHFTIVQGSAVPTDSQLEKGPAHYRNTQLPGQVGNFAMAGHRVGKGEPFLNLDQLRAGDPVIVETGSAWYVYRVKGQQHGLSKQDSDGIPGREIVTPSDGDVLLPKPDHAGATADEPLLTMTTCHPKYSASKRMIVFAALDKSATVPVTARSGKGVLTMPASVRALYSQVSS